MTRDGEGMQVPCTLHFKGHKKFVNILKKELSGTLELDRHIFCTTKKDNTQLLQNMLNVLDYSTIYLLTCHVLTNVIRVIEGKIV